MPYYIRVLAETEQRISLHRLRERLQGAGLEAALVVEEGTENEWDSLLLSHADGSEIAVIERNPVLVGTVGGEELREFIAAMETARPRTAANWLREYLPKVKVIYAFQLLDGTDKNSGFEAVWNIQNALWNILGGIFQSDGEGFSNPEGYQIIWEFSERASGLWRMAVLDGDGNWLPFEMELSNRGQRDEFLEGKIPSGVKVLFSGR